MWYYYITIVYRVLKINNCSIVWCDVLFFIFLNAIRNVSYFHNESYNIFEECSQIADDAECTHIKTTEWIINNIIEYCQIGKFISKFLKYNCIMYSSYPITFILKRYYWMGYRFEMNRVTEYNSGIFNSPEIYYYFSDNVYTHFPNNDRLLETRSMTL